jgi:hypothetical protein
VNFLYPEIVAGAMLVALILCLVLTRRAVREKPLVVHLADLSSEENLRVNVPAMVCILLFVAALAAALGEPVSFWRDERQASLPVQLVFDTSMSMAAEDYGARSRLDMAKKVGLVLLSRIKGLSAVSQFASSAFIRPLSIDRERNAYILEYWINAGGSSGNDSNVQSLLMAIDERYSGKPNKPIVMIVFSDGGGFLPADEHILERLSAKGIRIVAVGFGSEHPQPIPKYNNQGEFIGYVKSRNSIIKSSYNSKTLETLARSTNGLMVRFDPSRLPADINDPRIERILRFIADKEVESEGEDRIANMHHAPLLLASLCLLAVAMVIMRKENVLG